jgi:hypothetical protein
MIFKAFRKQPRPEIFPYTSRCSYLRSAAANFHPQADLDCIVVGIVKDELDVEMSKSGVRQGS